MKRISWLMSLLVVLAMACGDDDTGGTDSGPGTDGGGDDGGGMVELPVAMNGDGADPTDETGINLDPSTAEAPNMACIDMLSAPVGGDPQDFSVRIQEFRTDDTLEGLCVKFYSDNMPIPGDTCDPATDLVTDEAGTVPVSGLADGWYAYRVFPKPGPSPSLQIAGSVQINEAAPSEDREVEGNSVSQATLDLIPTVLGFNQEPGTAIVAGTVWDCDEDPLWGTVARVFREDGTEIMEGSRSPDPHFRYFDGDDFPKSDQPFTHTDGIFVVANVPVGADGEFVFIEVWGVLTEGGEPEIISCERMPIFADTISIVNMGPRRADIAACPNLP